MVHGNGEDHTIFDKAVDILQKHFTCYCIDSRGHGQSSPVFELHYNDMADDIVSLICLLDLKDVIYYGFSDGGIIGLIVSSRCDRITSLIVSGANLNPCGIKPVLRAVFRIRFFFTRYTKLRLMLYEPEITDDLLKQITAPVLVLAGSRDLICESQTFHIASVIPAAELRILNGEDHGSYIVHNPRIGEIIRDYLLLQ